MGRKLPVFLADGEPERLMKAATRERDRLLILTGLSMGLRVSELTHLQIPDIDFRRKILWVRAGKGDKDRALPIPKVLAGPLRGWVGKRQTGRVFPSPRGNDSPLTSRAVQKLIKRLAVKAGLREALKPRRCTPHKLRHSFATNLVARGVNIYDVKELLGHSSISVTEYYLHSTPERLADAINAVWE